MAYVPPALRKKQQNALASNEEKQPAPGIYGQPTIDLPSLDDIQKHFWPTLVVNEVSDANQNEAVNVTTAAGTTKTASVQEAIISESDKAVLSRKQHSTLNSTEADPKRIRYVLLFHGAHPRWNEDHIIYVKTDLHLLPQISTADSIDSTTSDQPLASEIMIFDQSSKSTGHSSPRARFSFLGYYHLIHMQILEPKTPELVRMLEQKWTRTNRYGKARQIERDSKGWERSLSYKWAVLKFQEADKGGLESLPPQIRISQAEEHGERNVLQKSVNEMLRDLRLQEQSKGAVQA